MVWGGGSLGIYPSTQTHLLRIPQQAPSPAHTGCSGTGVPSFREAGPLTTESRSTFQVAKLDNRSGLIDLFWPGVLMVEQKSAGWDLGAAYAQAGTIATPCRSGSTPATSW